MAIFPSEAGNYQYITGVIGADGSKKQGEGFQVVRKFAGNYQIQFEQPFKEASVPVCTIIGSQSTTSNLSVAIIERLPESFTCVTSTPESPINSGFTFSVFGEV